MSHIVEARTSISNPDQALLAQAVELVASQHGGQIRDYYYTFELQKRKSSLALITPKIYRGIAIQVKKGKLVFVGDGWGYEDQYQQIQQEIVQTYVSLATMQALQALGYQTNVTDGEAGQIVLTGVSYA